MARAIRLDLTDSEQNVAHLALDHAVRVHWTPHAEDEAACQQMASDCRLGAMNLSPVEAELFAGALAAFLWASDTVLEAAEPEVAASRREDAEYLIMKLVKTALR
jgi:hypothetical protein